MHPVVPGATDQSVHIMIIDAADGTPETGVTSATSGLALSYRVGATGAVTALTESDLAGVNSAHSDGGMIHVGGGLYRIDIPDAAVPASEGVVTWVFGTVSDMIVVPAAIVGRVVPLAPTTAGRSLDVSAGGEAGVDWANVGGQSTAVNLSATNIDVDQAVASVSGAVGSVTGNVGGNVAGSVGSVAAGGITAASIATGAVDADALAADAVTEIAAGISIPSAASIADAVWDEGTSGHQTAGTTGKALSDAGAAGDPWSASVRTLTQPAASVVAAVTGSNITLYTHATASISLTGLGNIAARDDLWFVVTSSPEDDTAAEVLIEETAGLTRLAGAAYATAAHGSITVDDAADGDITVTLAATAAAGLTRGTHGYAVKMRAGTTVTMLSHGGRCSIVQGAPEAIA